ncbi:MAG: hypothetical protein ACYSWU_23380 [Planctomycetota bacterium]|jgi:hypothetical protein
MRRIVSAIAVLLLAGVFAVPAPAQEEAKPRAVSHEVDRRDRCVMCHRIGGMEAVPDMPTSHVERTNDVCLLCHAPDSPMLTTAAPAAAHSIEGRDLCMTCHKAGAMEAIPDAPSGHEAIDPKYCTLCHEVAG